VKRNNNSNDFVFGIRPVIEAIEAGKTIDKLLVKKGLANKLWDELKTFVRDYSIPVQYVPEEKLHRITRKNHQGIIGFLSPVEFHSLDQIIPEIFESGETPYLLILDRISDVRNFGAIVRTAECAGVHAIVVPEKGHARIGGDAAKTSAGALFKVPVCREKDLKKTIQLLQESGIQVVACTEKTDDFYTTPDYTLPTAIVMGSEEDGIGDTLIRLADHLSAIPLNGSIGSLNVSVAAGIILFEGVRQRNQA